MGLGDFFSRYETTNSVGFIPLFPDDDKDEYYNRTINQAVAYSGTIDPPMITTTLLDVNKKVSFKGLDSLGGTSESNAEIRSLDETQLLGTIQSLDGTAVSIIDYNLGGAGNILGLMDYVMYYNTLNYGPGHFCGVSQPGFADNIYWNINGTYMRVNGPINIQDNDPVTWSITYTSEDGSVPFTQNGSMPKSAKFWGVRYTSSSAFSCASGDTFERVVYVDEQYMPIEDIDSVGVMAVRYKVSGVINKSKYIKAINARMGLPNAEVKKDCEDPELTPEEKEDCLKYKTQEEILEDSDVKTQILTYAVKYEEPYKNVIDQLLSGTLYQITIEGIDGGESTEISYMKILGPGTKYLDQATGFGCFIDGAGVVLRPTADEIEQGAEMQDARYIIPVEYIQKELNMREKYDTIENGLCWFIHNQKVTKKKWYQTGFFRILVWIAALALAAHGNPMMLIGLAGSTIVSGAFGAKAGLVVSLIMSVWTLGTSLISTAYISTINMFSMIANVANGIASLYFSYAMDSIIDEAKNLAEETKKTKEAIDDIAKEALFIPFSDVIDGMYATMYEVLYNQAYDQMSIYNRLTTVDTNRNYAKGLV